MFLPIVIMSFSLETIFLKYMAINEELHKDVFTEIHIERKLVAQK